MPEITPHLIDLILIAVAAEFVLLRRVFAGAAGEGRSVRLFLFLASGGALLLALRFSLAGAADAWIAAALLAGFLLHGGFLASVAKARARGAQA